MGDAPLQFSAPAEFRPRDAIVGPPPASTPAGAGHFTPDYPHVFPQAHLRQQHEQPAGPQHAFGSQLDMAHQQRTGPFDMNAMANALPQQPYRAQPYGQNPQRYNMATMPSPGTATQIPVTQFGTPNTMGPVLSQQYYVPQHPHMAQFYPTPLSPPPPTAMPSRPDLSYYPSSVVVNQSPHPGTHYYYTPAAPFPGQPPHVHGQVALGQYGPPNPQQHPSSRPQQPQPVSQDVNAAVSPEQQGNSMHFYPMAGEEHHTNYATVSPESRQNIVRGPPRKPRQSGKSATNSSTPPFSKKGNKKQPSEGQANSE